jgi:hypothetical protein
MKKIQELWSTPKKELSGILLIHTFIECRVQPLAAWAHCMWEYTDHRNPTRMTSDELKEVEIDDGIRAVTKIKKKVVVQKNFGAMAFSKSFHRTEVWSLP